MFNPDVVREEQRALRKASADKDAENARLQSRIEELERALKFYADPKSYKEVPVGYQLMSAVECDGGCQARTALEAANKGGK